MMTEGLTTGLYWVKVKKYPKWWQVARLQLDGWVVTPYTEVFPKKIPDDQIIEVGPKVEGPGQ